MIRLVPAGPIQQRRVQLCQPRVALDGAVHQRIHHPPQQGIAVVQLSGLIAVPDGLQLFHGGAEDIVVLHARLLDNLHVGAVQRPQGHRTVQHQLHVAGAGGFGAGRGDLFGDVGGGDDLLRIRTVIILNEQHLQFPVHSRVAVDEPGDAVDIPDDRLGTVVAGSGFRAEQERGGGEVGQIACLQLEVDGHDGQGVQKLPLILVEALHLHVEQEVGRQHHVLPLPDLVAQLLLLHQLHPVESSHQVVVDFIFQLRQPV